MPHHCVGNTTSPSLEIAFMSGLMVINGCFIIFCMADLGKFAPGSDEITSIASLSPRLSRSMVVNSPGLYCGYPCEKSIAYGKPVCQAKTTFAPVTLKWPRIGEITNLVLLLRSRV